MIGIRYFIALCLSVLTACALSLDSSLDGKRCDSQGACVRGYVCSPAGICERAGQAPDAAVPDAQGAPDAASSNALDASLADAGEVTAPDNAIADAGQSDTGTTHDAGDVPVSQPPAQPPAMTTSADAGVVVTTPPTIGPPTMMPVAPPATPGGDAAPPAPDVMPPASMGMLSGMMMPPCPMERAKCGDVCADVQMDSNHCGGCDSACDKPDGCKHDACKKPGP